MGETIAVLPDLASLYVCPECHSALALSLGSMTPDTPPQFSEVMFGALTCSSPACARIYPIEYTIPLFLPQDVLDNRDFGLR